MAPIEWRPEFSVGDPAIDHEHRELIGLVNRVAGTIVGQWPQADVEDRLGELLQAVSAHFALEERQMREAGYDRLTEHKADHERLLDVLRDLMDTPVDAPGQPAERLTAALEAWFAEHFRSHDARLHRRLGPHREPSAR